MQRFSPSSKGYEPHMRLPSSGVLQQEDKPKEHLALMVLTFRRTKGSGKERLHSLKVTHKISQAPINHDRKRNWEGAWVSHTH